MLKELLRNKRFLSEIKNFYKKNSDEVIDILLFGSIVRGKEKPRDIDLLIIYKSKENFDLNYQLRKIARKHYPNIEVTSRTYQKLFDPAFLAAESFLSEGFSLIMNKHISKGLGYSPMTLFRYDLKGFSKSKRMRFYYALYGRKKHEEGILKKTQSVKFSDTVILTPINYAEETREFLDVWKINFIETPILIPLRIISSDIFKKP